MLARLADRFQWLTNGARDLPADQRTLQSTLDYAGAVATSGDYARAQQIYEDAALWRRLDDPNGLAWILCLMGGNAQYREQCAQAAALWQEGLELLRPVPVAKLGAKQEA